MLGLVSLAAGIILGAALVLLCEYLIFLNPFGKDVPDTGFREQFVPFRIPRVSAALSA